MTSVFWRNLCAVDYFKLSYLGYRANMVYWFGSVQNT